MSQKKKLYSVLVFLLLIFTVLGAVLIQNSPSPVSEIDDGLVVPSGTPEGPLFVVPESPLGILGSISALAAGLSVVVLKRKKTN